MMAPKLVGLPVDLVGPHFSLCALLRRRRPAGVLGQAARSLLFLASVAVLLFAVSAFSDSSSSSRRDQILSELQILKLKTARLESILEDSTEKLNTRASQIEEKKKLVMDMEKTIQLLQNDLHTVKGSFSGLLHAEDQIHSLEEEVQLLWDQSRENKDNINALKSSADNAKENIKIVNSQVERMESMVTEQWIQIQKLEQAFQTTKMMTSKVLKRSLQRSNYQSTGTRNFMMKKVVQIFRGFRRYIHDVANPPDSFFLGASVSRSGMPRTYSQFKRIISYGQKCHYQLQDWIEHVVGAHESTDVIIIIWFFITVFFAMLITSLARILT